MVLPRRVPWVNHEEYEEVFSLLFASNGSSEAQYRAVRRIHVWQSRGCCPYAAEATASILAVIMRDTSAGRASTSAFPEELRLAYAMSLTRFVNGLVDPAQQGPFARSIASIASQIGLPLWFVELRHAATHEDLPSLQVLRDAARKAMDWLYQRYWLVQMQSTSNEAIEADETVLTEAQRAEVTRLLTLYKRLQKELLRDASVPKDKEIGRAIQAINRWILDVGTSPTALGNSEAFTGSSSADGSAPGCQILARILTGIGYLVPTSKKKRPSSKDNTLPVELYQIWVPLLESLDDTFEGFTSTVIWHCLDLLAGDKATMKSSTVMQGRSYVTTIKLWIAALLQNEDDDLHEEVLRFCLTHSNTNTAYVLSSTLDGRDHLAQSVKALQRIQQSQPALVAPLEDTDIENALLRLEQRLKGLESAQLDRPSYSVIPETSEGLPTSSLKWSLVPAQQWQSCPMGLLPGGVRPNLEIM